MVAEAKWGDIEYREVPVEVKPEVRVEGGQHLGQTFCVVKLWNVVRHPEKYPQLTILVYPVMQFALTL